MIRVKVSAEDPDGRALAEAAGVQARGGVVAFPTDTLYGLAADPRNPLAVDRVYRAKGRPPVQALPLVAADLDQVERAAHHLTRLARRLAWCFWPGPLTLLIEASPALTPAVHGGTGAVAIRVPDHPVARGLAAAAGHAVTASSANRSGEPAPASPEEVARTFGVEVDMLLDSGPTRGGQPSTIVDTRGAEPLLVRVGAIPFDWVMRSL